MSSEVIPAKAGTQANWTLGISSKRIDYDAECCQMVRYIAKTPCVYVLASRRNGTLYIGVTSDLVGRIALHNQNLVEGFTKRYGVHVLVYYEMHQTMDAAITREKQLKEWQRAWKIRIIENMNPEWADLFDEASGAILSGPGDDERRR